MWWLTTQAQDQLIDHKQAQDNAVGHQAATGSNGDHKQAQGNEVAHHPGTGSVAVWPGLNSQ